MSPFVPRPLLSEVSAQGLHVPSTQDDRGTRRQPSRDKVPVSVMLARVEGADSSTAGWKQERSVRTPSIGRSSCDAYPMPSCWDEHSDSPEV